MRKATALVTAVLLAPLALVPPSHAADTAPTKFVAPAEEILISSGESATFKEGNVAQIVLEAPETTNRSAGEQTAPSCVEAKKEKGFIQVYNNCTHPLRIKVVLAFSPDTACKLIQPGTRSNVGFAGLQGRVDGVLVC